MNKILLFFLLFFTSFVYSQVRFEGVITDSMGNTIMGANVIAVEKESQILDGFGISNNSGFYRISLKKNTEYQIKISFIGFQQIELDLNLSEDFEKNFVLEQQAEALDEVEIVYEMPVTIKGDTIVYNADSFNTGSEKKLGDVLKNMPGIEVTDEGTIEVEGKEITKITVEGKDFFDGDSKLATQNLPANAVNKVEVLRNFTEVSQLRNVTNNEDNIAINISLKSGKDKFWFGEIVGAKGNEDTYLAAPKIFYYAKDLSMSILGNTNNLGEPVLSRRDFYRFGGGFRNLNQQTGTSINISSDGAGIGNLQNNRAKSIDAKLGAYNFSKSINEKLEISGFAIFAETQNIVEEKISRIYSATNAKQETSEDVVQDNQQQLYKFTTEYNPNEAIKTNILGAENVMDACIKYGVKKCVFLSTDKAVYPINAMGISKAMMEKVAVAKSRNVSDTIINVTRYGNVMASRGSVIPLFVNQILSDNEITITDPEMTRFMMTLNDAVDLVLYAFRHGEQGDIFVQKAPAATIHVLAVALTELLDKPEHPINIIGTRHGEKLFEALLSREEVVTAEDLGDYFKVAPDNRDLNYDKFVESGEVKISKSEDYNSHNTVRLDVGAMKELLMKIPLMQDITDNKAL